MWPEAVAENDDMVPAWTTIIFRKLSTESRPHAKHMKDLRRRDHAAHLLGAPLPHHVERRHLHERECLERPGLCPPLDVIQRMYVQWLGRVELVLAQHDKPLGTGIWQ